MSTQRTYHIAGKQLRIDVGSVLDVPAEVIVSSDDYRLTMSGGVSAAIRAAAGNALVLDASKAVPREAGDVVVTTAGALSARYVFHVVTIGPQQWEDPSTALDVIGLVRRATRSCLELMQPLGVRSIVFPALGTGAAGYPIEDSASAMAEVVNVVLSQTDWHLDVSIMLMSRTLASPIQYVAFYEEFARRVPAVAAHESTQNAPLRIFQPPPGISDLLELEQQRQALEQELADLPPGDARRMELRAALERNTDERLRAAQHEQSKRQKAASVFVSYARKDEQLLEKLRDHLGGLRTGGYIKDWTDGRIVPGQEWEPEITRRLDEADIILLLITSSFLGSEFIGRVELSRALDRHRHGEAVVIPVILRPADWQSTDLAGLQALPKGAKAVTTWADTDAAYVDVAHGVRRAVDAWRTKLEEDDSSNRLLGEIT